MGRRGKSWIQSLGCKLVRAGTRLLQEVLRRTVLGLHPSSSSFPS